MGKCFAGQIVCVHASDSGLRDRLLAELAEGGAQCVDAGNQGTAAGIFHVFDKFEGEEYEWARRSKVPVIGVRCVRQCAASRPPRPLPCSDWPVCCLCLDGLTICTSALGVSERQNAEAMVHGMGGAYVRLWQEGRVDYVISRTVRSEKYKTAVRMGLHVLTPDWVRRCWEEHTQLAPEPFRLPPFTGLAICTTGFSAERTAEIAAAIHEHGGTYEANLSRGQCTHLVTEKLDKSTKGGTLKYKTAMLWGNSVIAVVSEKWLLESMRQGVCLDESLYPVPPARNPLRRPAESTGQAASREGGGGRGGGPPAGSCVTDGVGTVAAGVGADADMVTGSTSHGGGGMGGVTATAEDPAGLDDPMSLLHPEDAAGSQPSVRIISSTGVGTAVHGAGAGFAGGARHTARGQPSQGAPRGEARAKAASLAWDFSLSDEDEDDDDDDTAEDDGESCRAQSYLSGCRVYLLGVGDTESRKNCVRAVHDGGALLLRCFDDRVSHVVVGDPKPSELAPMKARVLAGSLQLVDVGWLHACVAQKACLPANPEVTARWLAYGGRPSVAATASNDRALQPFSSSQPPVGAPKKGASGPNGGKTTGGFARTGSGVLDFGGGADGGRPNSGIPPKGRLVRSSSGSVSGVTAAGSQLPHGMKTRPVEPASSTLASRGQGAAVECASSQPGLTAVAREQGHGEQGARGEGEGGSGRDALLVGVGGGGRSVGRGDTVAAERISSAADGSPIAPAEEGDGGAGEGGREDEQDCGGTLVEPGDDGWGLRRVQPVGGQPASDALDWWLDAKGPGSQACRGKAVVADGGVHGTSRAGGGVAADGVSAGHGGVAGRAGSKAPGAPSGPFQGMTFAVLGLSSAEEVEVTGLVNGGGGVLVDAQLVEAGELPRGAQPHARDPRPGRLYSGDADPSGEPASVCHLVVPLSTAGMGERIRGGLRQCAVVTLLWLRLCKQMGERIPPDAHVGLRPLAHPLSLPLASAPKHSLCFSGYRDATRGAAKILAQALGFGVVYDDILRKGRSSHLVCPEEEDTEKCVRARKWGLKLVTSEWIQQCVLQGKVVPEKPFHPPFKPPACARMGGRHPPAEALPADQREDDLHVACTGQSEVGASLAGGHLAVDAPLARPGGLSLAVGTAAPTKRDPAGDVGHRPAVTARPPPPPRQPMPSQPHQFVPLKVSLSQADAGGGCTSPGTVPAPGNTGALRHGGGGGGQAGKPATAAAAVTPVPTPVASRKSPRVSQSPLVNRRLSAGTSLALTPGGGRWGSQGRLARSPQKTGGLSGSGKRKGGVTPGSKGVGAGSGASGCSQGPAASAPAGPDPWDLGTLGWKEDGKEGGKEGDLGSQQGASSRMSGEGVVGADGQMAVDEWTMGGRLDGNNGGAAGNGRQSAKAEATSPLQAAVLAISGKSPQGHAQPPGGQSTSSLPRHGENRPNSNTSHHPSSTSHHHNPGAASQQSGGLALAGIRDVLDQGGREAQGVGWELPESSSQVGARPLGGSVRVTRSQGVAQGSSAANTGLPGGQADAPGDEDGASQGDQGVRSSAGQASLGAGLNAGSMGAGREAGGLSPMAQGEGRESGGVAGGSSPPVGAGGKRARQGWAGDGAGEGGDDTAAKRVRPGVGGQGMTSSVDTAAGGGGPSWRKTAGAAAVGVEAGDPATGRRGGAGGAATGKAGGGASGPAGGGAAVGSTLVEATKGKLVEVIEEYLKQRPLPQGSGSVALERGTRRAPRAKAKEGTASGLTTVPSSHERGRAHSGPFHAASSPSGGGVGRAVGAAKDWGRDATNDTQGFARELGLIREDEEARDMSVGAGAVGGSRKRVRGPLENGSAGPSMSAGNRGGDACSQDLVERSAFAVPVLPSPALESQRMASQDWQDSQLFESQVGYDTEHQKRLHLLEMKRVTRSASNSSGGVSNVTTGTLAAGAGGVSSRPSGTTGLTVGSKGMANAGKKMLCQIADKHS